MFELWDPVSLVYGGAVFVRAGTLLLMLPFFNRPVPITVRIAMALICAVIVVPIVPPHGSLMVPTHFADLVPLFLKEAFIGFVMGYAVSVIFHICQIAGKIISMEMGLMQSSIFNPLVSEQESTMGTVLSMLAIVMIFTLNIHHLILAAFLRSFQLIPAGAPVFQHGRLVIETFLQQSASVFLTSVQMAAPMIAVNFITAFSFAVLGRAVPSINVLILSFPVRLGVGFSVLVLVLTVIAQFLANTAEDTPYRMLRMLPF